MSAMHAATEERECGRDRRRHDRRPDCVPLHYSMNTGEPDEWLGVGMRPRAFVRATSLDIGAGGAKIVGPDLLAPGSRVDMQIVLSPWVVKARGQVVHSEMDVETWTSTAGVQFVDFAPEERLKLLLYLGIERAMDTEAIARAMDEDLGTSPDPPAY